MFICKIATYLIEILYPRRCPICGNIVQLKGLKACSDCRSKLSFVPEPRCLKCGKHVTISEQEYCYDCVRNNHHYRRGFSAFEYNDVMKHSIAQFKFHYKKEYADFYVEEMVHCFRESVRRINPDVLIPVPIHNSRRRQRGFNQTELLAKGIGKALNIPVVTKLLIRNKKTLPQKQLNNLERVKNLEKAFTFSTIGLERDSIKINKAMLVDDIYTTGSTIEACTRVLLENGVKEVYFLSLCIGKGY